MSHFSIPVRGGKGAQPDDFGPGYHYLDLLDQSVWREAAVELGDRATLKGLAKYAHKFVGADKMHKYVACKSGSGLYLADRAAVWETPLETVSAVTIFHRLRELLADEQFGAITVSGPEVRGGGSGVPTLDSGYLEELRAFHAQAELGCPVDHYVRVMSQPSMVWLFASRVGYQTVDDCGSFADAVLWVNPRFGQLKSRFTAWLARAVSTPATLSDKADALTTHRVVREAYEARMPEDPARGCTPRRCLCGAEGKCFVRQMPVWSKAEGCFGFCSRAGFDSVDAANSYGEVVGGRSNARVFAKFSAAQGSTERLRVLVTGIKPHVDYATTHCVGWPLHMHMEDERDVVHEVPVHGCREGTFTNKALPLRFKHWAVSVPSGVKLHARDGSLTVWGDSVHPLVCGSGWADFRVEGEITAFEVAAFTDSSWERFKAAHFVQYAVEGGMTAAAYAKSSPRYVVAGLKGGVSATYTGETEPVDHIDGYNKAYELAVGQCWVVRGGGTAKIRNEADTVIMAPKAGVQVWDVLGIADCTFMLMSNDKPWDIGMRSGISWHGCHDYFIQWHYAVVNDDYEIDDGGPSDDDSGYFMDVKRYGPGHPRVKGRRLTYEKTAIGAFDSGSD